MNTYLVEVIESHLIYVDAESQDEALEQAEEMALMGMIGFNINTDTADAHIF